MYVYYMSDAPIGVSWQLSDYSIVGAFVCFLVPINVFSTIYIILIYLLLVTCILWYVLLLDVLIDICFVFTL